MKCNGKCFMFWNSCRHTDVTWYLGDDCIYKVNKVGFYAGLGVVAVIAVITVAVLTAYLVINQKKANRWAILIVNDDDQNHITCANYYVYIQWWNGQVLLGDVFYTFKHRCKLYYFIISSIVYMCNNILTESNWAAIMVYKEID